MSSKIVLLFAVISIVLLSGCNTGPAPSQNGNGPTQILQDEPPVQNPNELFKLQLQNDVNRANIEFVELSTKSARASADEDYTTAKAELNRAITKFAEIKTLLNNYKTSFGYDDWYTRDYEIHIQGFDELNTGQMSLYSAFETTANANTNLTDSQKESVLEDYYNAKTSYQNANDLFETMEDTQRFKTADRVISVYGLIIWVIEPKIAELEGS
jgi:hypothetical protein